jgi:FAD dependent oxidoreductase TIGR03364
MATATYDLLVVGAGVMGTFHAYHARRAGLKVALIEQHKHPQSASTRNFGQVVPSGMNAKWQTIGRRSLALYKDLQQKVDLSLQPNGSVYIASNAEEESLIEELAVRNQTADYPSHLLTKAECLERWPVLHPKYCKAGLFFPEEISLDARVAVHRVIGYMVEQMGLDYFPACQIQQVEMAGNDVRLFSSDGRAFAGVQAVICSGSEFQNLFPELFRESDLVATKLQMLRTEPQPSQPILGNILTGRTIRRYESFTECPSYAAIKAREPEMGFAKQYGVHILLTQAPDGTVVLGDSHEYADAKDKDDLGYELDNTINRFMMDEAMKIFQLQNWRIQSAWCGIYSQCKTRDLFQETIDGRLHIVTGIGGKGMTGSPGFAEQHIEQLFAEVLEKQE